MLLDAVHAARDLGRLHEIASVLIRHGAGDLVRRMGLASVLDRAGKVLHWNALRRLDRPPEVRFREALEELGPTFVKAGQVLAGRSDLLPPDWTRELSRLQERASRVDEGALRAQLLEDLGAAPEEVFATFDPEPLAAASISQVHRAELTDGRAVVLKVRRPGMERVVDADLRLLRHLALLLEERIPELRRFQPVRLATQFARTLRAELDFRIEARNTARLASVLRPFPGLRVPEVHAAYTCERLLVLERFEGPSVGQWSLAGQAPDLTSRAAAATGARAMLHMVLEEGVFHADPHPGNVMLLKNGALGLIDFGMLGFLREARREELLDLLFAALHRDAALATDTLENWSESALDRNQLEQDCAQFIDRYHGVELGALDVASMLRDLTGLLRDNDLVLPQDVALLLKVLLQLDELGRALDPEFQLAEELEPFVAAAGSGRRGPLAQALRTGTEAAALARDLPRELRRVLLMAGRGRLRVDVDPEALEGFGRRLDRSANRLAISLITAALIVGTSISLSVEGLGRVAGLPLFAFLGFVSSIAVGVVLLVALARSG